MEKYSDRVGTRMADAAAAAGIREEPPVGVESLPVSAIILHARRCGVPVSYILDDALGLGGNR